MYSAPAILKQWIDLVLEHGWAHGRSGNNLQDKIIFNALTAGGTREAYAAKRHNNFTIREFLTPFEQTANLCKMIYLPPFVVHGTHLLGAVDLESYARLYRTLLERLIKGEFDIKIIKQFEYLNDWLAKETGMSKL
jgi:glutathione-regulated potassium-efflux system ancillary protein KefG